MEEKPFRRVTKRLLSEPSPLYSLSTSSRIGRPAGERGEEGTAADGRSDDSRSGEEKGSAERGQFREDVILDFAAFESSLVRIQFLRQSNARERERYAAEKIQIEATAQEVRDSTARLRVQLDRAQKTLAVRKTYDGLAEKITGNKALKPRDEQGLNLDKLRAEIEELERESRDHDSAWSERREQFSRIADEGLRLRRLIRDEKDEVAAQPEGEDLLELERLTGGRSNLGTPGPEDGGLTPMHHTQGGSSGLTPRSGRGTPQPEEIGAGAIDKPLETIPEVREKEDAQMADEGEVWDPDHRFGGPNPEAHPAAPPGRSKTEEEPEQMEVDNHQVISK